MSHASHSSVPTHVAIIMDGNGRWAQSQGMVRVLGHERGVDAAERTVRACYRRNIEYLTLFTFAMANWQRPIDEVARLMELCQEFAVKHRQEYVERGVRVRVIGELSYVPTDVREEIEETLRATAGGTRMTVTLALSYSSRLDMVNAVRAIVERARAGAIEPEQIDQSLFKGYLASCGLPDPDLLIRTGGERRLSDFLLFECANSELYFCEAMWPEFDEELLDEALASYAGRQRRFGRTGAQVQREERDTGMWCEPGSPTRHPVMVNGGLRLDLAAPRSTV